MDKIKVLHMPVTNSGSGVTQYILQNWSFINKDKFRFDFATRSPKLDFADKMISEGCKVHYLSCSAEENEKQFITEMNRIFDEGYDAVHLHTSFWKSFRVEQIAMERKVPIVIVHSHSTMIDIADDKKRTEALELHKKQKKLFSQDMATHFCACSNPAADWLFGEQIPRNRIQILNNAVDTDAFSYKPEIRKEYRLELGLEGCFVLGHIGRFVYQKNHGMLIDIFKKVCDKVDNARLMLIGDGELMESIREKSKLYGIENKVIFMGRRSDVSYLMQAIDMFLLPSRFEGLGLVLIEAQTSGLKCLASEFVPKEAMVTPNMEYVPYDTDKWCLKILEYADGYERKDCSDLVTNAGYSLKNQIRLIEDLYLGKK
jgi:glycosyltransferase involved in cell wall biosynthesis